MNRAPALDREFCDRWEPLEVDCGDDVFLMEVPGALSAGEWFDSCAVADCACHEVARFMGHDGEGN